MKLLIVGAGGHGQVVSEIARELGYDHIEFLDDNYKDAIGGLSDIEKYASEFEFAFVAIGKNKNRSDLIEILVKHGYKIPVLIHPTAYVSKSATLGAGTVVAPMAVVNANTTIGVGGIISAAAVVDHNVVIGEFAHIDAGVIVKSGGAVASFTKIDAGQVVPGY